LSHGAARAGIERVAAGRGVVGAERGARLERHAGDAADVEFAAHDMRGAGKGLFGRRGIAERTIDTDIVSRLVPQRRRAGGHGILGMQHEWQFLIAHDDRFGCVHRFDLGGGDDHRHGFTDVANAIRRQ
jgi:hypothetical protein